MQLIKLTNKEYWDKNRNEFEPFLVKGCGFSHVLEKILPINARFRCVEIGAYPGTHLCYLAKKFSYYPVAIEYSDHVNHIEQMFRFNGINDYTIVNKDFFEIENDQFDVVTSFGFIEHFDNYEEVIQKHLEILNPGGFLVLAVPYIEGFQGWLRRLVYEDEHMNSVLASHNRSIMSIDALKSAVSGNAKILFLDFVMNAQIWFSWKDSFIKDEMRWLVRFINCIEGLIGHRVPSSKYYSPMILLIAQK